MDNIVTDTISRLPYTSVDKYEPSIIKPHCCTNDLFAIGRAENNRYCFPINILNLQIEQQK